MIWMYDADVKYTSFNGDYDIRSCWVWKLMKCCDSTSKVEGDSTVDPEFCFIHSGFEVPVGHIQV